MAKPKFRPVETTVVELAAMAFAAQRVNGTLYRDAQVFVEETNDFRAVTPNKEFMRNTLVKEGAQLTVTDEDREQAQLAVSAIQQDVMLKTLAGRRVNDFVQSMATALAQETVTQRDCGMFAFIPRTYELMLKSQSVQETSLSLQGTSKYIGNVGDKVVLDFTMLDKRYLQQYNCWSIYGHDSNGNLVQFLSAHSELGCSGRIQGKVKRLELSAFRNNAQVTNLNYVKAV